METVAFLELRETSSLIGDLGLVLTDWIFYEVTFRDTRSTNINLDCHFPRKVVSQWHLHQ